MSSFTLSDLMKSMIFLEGAQPTGILKSPYTFWCNGLSDLFIFGPVFFMYPQSHTQRLLIEVSSDTVFVHGSHLCLAYVVLPGMQSGGPHTFRTLRLQNHTLGRRETLEPGLPAEAGFPSCAEQCDPW